MNQMLKIPKKKCCSTKKNSWSDYVYMISHRFDSQTKSKWFQVLELGMSMNTLKTAKVQNKNTEVAM